MLSDDTLLVLVAQHLDLLPPWTMLISGLGGCLAALAYLEWEPKQ